jgi:citrate synthase
MYDPDETADWLTVETALSRLGVARQTLYAYVSRGFVRARPAPDDPRRSLYDRRGIDALLERRQRGRARRDVAASTIDFGEPVLASRITAIADGVLRYRGHDAMLLSDTATLEEAAAILWETPAFPALPDSTYAAGEPGPPIARCLRQAAAMSGPGMWARNTTALHQDAAAALRRMAEAACDRRAGGPIHSVMAAAFGTGPEGADLIRRALVLCADHELNASAFAVRVVASTGAALPCCLLAGLAALSGPLHGGVTSQVAALLAEPGMTADPRAAIAARLARGEHVPGFGQRLYPDGDPRAIALLGAFEPSPPLRAVFSAVTELTGQRPNIDAALVTLEQHLRLPEGSALAIFAVGRTAGWIAHALEQRQDGRLIRPRATYAGP